MEVIAAPDPRQSRKTLTSFISFERVALIGAAVFVVCLIARYDVCFQDVEVPWEVAPVATQHGTGFRFKDVFAAFDTRMEAGDQRIRIVDHLVSILTLKTRLALWRVLPPHPSFTPVWLLSLVLGPILFFRFLDIGTGSRSAAMAGTAVYLSSPGLLSGVTMMFRPGKPLANVIVIAALYLSARIDQSIQTGTAPGTSRPPAWSFAGLLILLAAAPFVDETAAFAYLIPVIWCPYLFWRHRGGGGARGDALRHWLWLLLPAAVDAVAILAIVPRLTRLATGQPFDFLRAQTLMAWTGMRADQPPGILYVKFDAVHLLWQGGNLLIPQLLPWRTAHVLTPVAVSPEVPILPLVCLAVAIGCVGLAIRRQRVFWPAFGRFAALAAAFIVFQVLVLLFHPQELSATGFYYGAIFSILFAALAGIAYAAARRRSRVGGWTARVLLTWILVISATNVVAINSVWIAHSNFKSLMVFRTLRVYQKVGDWAPVEALAARHQRVIEQPAATAADAFYTTDVEPATPAGAFVDAMTIWGRWRRGDADILGSRSLNFRNLWILTELSFEDAAR